MWTFIKLVALVGLFAGLVAEGGEVRGTVKKGATLVPQGVVIDATCDGQPCGRAITDDTGTFRLHVAAKGLCTLTVRYEGHAPSMELAMSTQRLAQNLVLDQIEHGYRLRSE